MTQIIGFIITMVCISLFWRWMGYLKTQSEIKKEERLDRLRSQAFDPNLIDPMNPRADELREIARRLH
jgi:hypothetical protein